MARIQVIEHADSCPVARVGDWLVAGGAVLDVRRGHRGEEIPTTLYDSGADAVVVMGGPQDSWDDVAGPWFANTRALVADAVRHEAPVLGICLGHQIVAHALGGRVGRGPTTQRGARSINLTAAGRTDPVLGALSTTSAMLHWNTDLVHVAPPGAQVLATSELADGTTGIQAFRYGSALGLQGHPEVTPVIVEKWITDDVDDGKLNHAEAARLRQAHHDQDDQLATTGRAIIDAWLSTLIK